MLDGPDDVHTRHTVQERQLLAVRFGLCLTFPAPDQGRYLQIVEELARERCLDLPREELNEGVLLWDRWHAGRSARQFVDELEARLADGSDPSS